MPTAGHRSASPRTATRRRAERLVLEPRPPEIRQARTFVEEFARDRSLPQATVAAAVLATSEAVTNAVMHAFPGNAEARDEVVVTASHDAEELVVVVADNGTGMRHHRPSEGAGIGLMLIADLANMFTVEHPQDRPGSVLTMRFAAAV